MDNSSSRIVDLQISNSCNILFTRYATSFIGEVKHSFHKILRILRVMLFDVVYYYTRVVN